MIIKRWQNYIDSSSIIFDKEQYAIIEQIQSAQNYVNSLSLPTKQTSVLQRLFKNKQHKTGYNFHKNIYLHGEVGCGKSMIMDLFFDTVIIAEKKRYHFHEFMLDVHKTLHKLKHEKDDSRFTIAIEEILANSKLLCFDEFQVTNIADAMIINRLFNVIFNKKIFVFSTSNIHPNDLYKNGLHRNRFLPFIDTLNEYFDIFHLQRQQDYRELKSKESNNVANSWLINAAEAFYQKYFELAKTNKLSPTTISVLSRNVNFISYDNNIAIADYKHLCEEEMYNTEYLAIAKQVDILFIDNFPNLSNDSKAAKRFIHMIDILYEYDVKLVINADMDIKDITIFTEFNSVFLRTMSRIKEMLL